MMHMTFYWGRDVTLLFDSWKTNSWISYAITLLACFFVSVFYQYMEDSRIRFKSLPSSHPPTDVNVPLLYRVYPELESSRNSWRTLSRFIGDIIFGVNSAIGYLLMLAIMSFNAGVFITIILGLSSGYLVFRSCYGEQSVDNDDDEVDYDKLLLDPQGSSQMYFVKWRKPLPCFIKVNVKGEVRDVVAGAVIRNEEGAWLNGISGCVTEVSSPLMAELWAIFYGIDVTLKLGMDIFYVMIESGDEEALELVKGNAGSTIFLQVQPVIKKRRKSILEVEDGMWKFMYH